MSGWNRQHNKYSRSNHRDACFFRSDLQLEKGARTGIFFMDKPHRIRGDLQRNNVSARYLQIPASCNFRMRISGYCFS